ncbi:hypothetical protein TruAng_005597 [Truncatella angustata]|nr:hypothetical protein TruAng_005597 [Truncatella angustata]
MATYQGPSRASAITAWAARVLRPSVSDVQLSSMELFRSIDEVVIVANIRPDDEVSRPILEAVALKYKNEFTFGIHIVKYESKEELNNPTVDCFRVIDGDRKVLNDPFDQVSLESFVIEASRFIEREWPMVYVFAATEAERANLRESLKKLARSHYESLTMVTVDPLEFPDLPAKLGLEPEIFPAGAVHQLSTNRIFPYPKGTPITPSSMQKWGLDVWQGRIKPWSPPGTTTALVSEAPGQIKASRKVSIRSYPGIKINIGRDEL